MDTTVDDPVIGRTLDGRYRVDSRVARGGMATVYLGHDTRLDRRVALKVMYPSLAQDEEGVRRFIDEAKSAARLSHPNIVAVYDQGADAGHVYLAMEFVPGQTLRDLLRRRGALRPREALQLMVPVLGGLAAAHQAGLMHRDIKPENVLITEDGRVKVVDFGLARAVESSVHHTKTGLIIGTVGYLAPEQVVHGSSDARGDVYAAGIMLFELLTGRQPHRGDTPLAVAYKHVNEVVPAPSRLMNGIPQSLDTLVAMATSRDPNLRPADAGQLLQAIFEVLRTLPADGAAPLPRPVPVVDPGADMHTEAMQQANHTLIASRQDMPPPPEEPGAGQEGGGHERRPRRWYTSRPLTVVICAVVVVALLAGVGWWVLIGRWSDVPRLAGMPVAAAKAKASRDGFSVRVGAARYDDSVPAGKIVATDPNQGAKIAHDGTITLFPSKGPSTIAIPDVANKTLDQARQALRDAGLRVGQIRREADPNVAKGTVEGTDPPAGSRQRVTQPVTLVVSTGITVPDVRNQNVNDAGTNLGNIGLTMSRVDRYSAKPADTVIAQHPRPGSGANRGDVVQVVVSKGPRLVPVPDLSDMSVDDASKALTDAGFTVKVNRIMDGDKVVRWDPSDKAPKGSEITIWATP